MPYYDLSVSTGPLDIRDKWTLSDEDIALVRRVATERAAGNYQDTERWKATRGGKDQGIEENSVAAEIAAARNLAVKWNSFEVDRRLTGDLEHKIEVKHAPDHGLNLLVNQAQLQELLDEGENRPHLLVTGTIPTFWLRGWLFAQDIPELGDLKDPGNAGDPCYIVQREYLYSVGSLRAWIAGRVFRYS